MKKYMKKKKNKMYNWKGPAQQMEDWKQKKPKKKEKKTENQ